MEHPGVYVAEVPAGGHAIEGVATSITAFVGSAVRGPVDEAVPISSFADFGRLFGGLAVDSGLGYAVRDFYLNGGDAALVVRLVNGATSAGWSLDGLFLEANNPGSWANGLTAQVTHPSPAEATEIARDQGLADDGATTFTLQLRLGEEEEMFANVSIVDGPMRVDKVLASTSRLVRVAEPLPVERPGESEDALTTIAAGLNGALPRVETYFPPTDGHRGVRALLSADLFNILVLPPAVPWGDVPGEVWPGALTFAHEQRAFLIVDPPVSATSTSILGWITEGAGLGGNSARNAALYFPRIVEADCVREGQLGTFVTSGAMAGLYARTDKTRGVWKSPAGLDAWLVGALGLSPDVTTADNAALNTQGINIIRSFSGNPPVSWGAGTIRRLSAASDEYVYLSVRRLALFIEDSVERGTRWTGAERNDELLWEQIRRSVENFLDTLFRQGGLQGTQPREAYGVRCGRDTTSQAELDLGMVNIEIFFAPLRPANFVHLVMRGR